MKYKYFKPFVDCSLNNMLKSPVISCILAILVIASIIMNVTALPGGKPKTTTTKKSTTTRKPTASPSPTPACAPKDYVCSRCGPGTVSWCAEAVAYCTSSAGNLDNYCFDAAYNNYSYMNNSGP